MPKYADRWVVNILHNSMHIGNTTLGSPAVITAGEVAKVWMLFFQVQFMECKPQFYPSSFLTHTHYHLNPFQLVSPGNRK